MDDGRGEGQTGRVCTHSKKREKALTTAHFQTCSLLFLDLKIGDL